MKKEKIVKILIPLVAVIVIIESVILVSNLSNAGSNNTEVTPTDTQFVSEVVEIDTSEPVADFIFETGTSEMKVGKSYKVNLSLVGKKDLGIGAMEIYAKYDSSKLTVSKLSVTKGFPEITKNSGIKSDLISAIFLWGVGESHLVKSGVIDTVLSFEVTPKIEGSSEISLVTGNVNEKSVTMIVEDSTAKPMAFLGNKLEINATK